MLGVQVARRLGERLEALAHLGLTETNAAFDDSPDEPGDTLGFFAFRSRDDISRRGGGARLTWRPAEGVFLTGGAEVEEQSIRSFTESDSEFGSSSDRSRAERTNRGFYAQAVALVAGGLALTGGARLDDNDAFGTFDTYRLGAAYRFPTGTRLRATFGTGFKEPTFFENFATGFAVGNPELDPERSRSWELGAEQRLLDGRLGLAATWFDQRFRDLIQFTFATEPEGPNFFNVAEANAAGLEVEAEARPLPGLTIAASWTVLDTEVTDAGFDAGEDATFVEGDRLLRRPTHVVAARAGYRRAGVAGGWIAVTHVGSRDDVDFGAFPARRLELEAYTRVDLAVSLHFLRAGGRYAFTPVVRVDNLLDERYEEARNFPAPGRTVIAGARIGVGAGRGE